MENALIVKEIYDLESDLQDYCHSSDLMVDVNENKKEAIIDCCGVKAFRKIWHSGKSPLLKFAVRLKNLNPHFEEIGKNKIKMVWG